MPLEIKSLPPLFIGRFQPFHLGHLDVVKQILRKHPCVIIGIGSAQYSKHINNPYSASLRAKMIQASLRAAGISKRQFELVKITDINNDTRWVAHVSRLCPSFGDVWSGTPKVRLLFRKDDKHKIVKPKVNLKISGTEIRRCIKLRKRWENLVPKIIVNLLSAAACGATK